MDMIHQNPTEFQRQVAQAATDYADLGWKVTLLHGVTQRDGHPCCTCQRGLDCVSPGKHPRLKAWQDEATDNPERLQGLFQRFPVSNIGVKLGPASNLVDVEFDDEQGRQTAERLLAGSFTLTYDSHRSTHRLYRFPEGLAIPTAVIHANGLELRFGTESKAAQSVLPPSVHASGQAYRWKQGLGPGETEIEPFPPALAELMQTAGHAGGGGNGEYVCENMLWDTPGATVGERNATLCRLVGRYLAVYGCTDYGTLLAHATAWNGKCASPKPATDVEKVVQSLWESEQRKRAQAEATAEAAQPSSQQQPAKPMLQTRRYTAIEALPIEWLWPGRIPLGMLTVMAGWGGWGKSTVATALAAIVSRGGRFPDGSDCPLGDAVILTAEESPEYMVKARLTALQADCNRVVDLQHVEENGEERPLVLPGDAGLLRDMLASLPAPKLLVVDTVADILDAQTDDHKNSPVRRCLTPLRRMAEKFQLAVVAIAHVNKTKDATADSKILGTVGFSNLARCSWHIGADPNDKQEDRKLKRRLLLPGKANIPLGNGWGFFTEWQDGAVVTRWDAEIVGDADQLYQGSQRPSGRPDKGPEVSDFLQAALVGGPRMPKDVLKQGKQLGYGRAILYRIAGEDGLIVGNGTWAIPPEDTYTF